MDRNSEDIEDNGGGKDDCLDILRELEFVCVLSEDMQRKRIFLLARRRRKCVGDDGYGEEQRAVVSLERRAFDASRWSCVDSGDEDGKLDLPRSLFGAESAVALAKVFQNDVYFQFDADFSPIDASVKLNVIFPCTQKHIDKYSTKHHVTIRETPEVYTKRTLPWVMSIPEGDLQWVYNALDKKAEVERLLFDDVDPIVGFVLHPDLKWDVSTGSVSDLYCLAICHRRDVRSLRDLNAEHLPMLKNIRNKSLVLIKEKFGLPPNKVRMYVHYYPSFWHFHVHITHVDFDPKNIRVAHARLLDDIIDNIELCGDYYQERTLTVELSSLHLLASSCD